MILSKRGSRKGNFSVTDEKKNMYRGNRRAKYARDHPKKKRMSELDQKVKKAGGTIRCYARGKAERSKKPLAQSPVNEEKEKAKIGLLVA